ncbi:Uncharacterised protein [Klebsiella pneumoniae]|uniref:Uncharacterized protein n=1 Tax=Klebsiella pneumoniae TaxID=573 RepID=A0A378CDI8_KLEPN|nr:Uncharacterised protein [Klebsiella pneumoniae]SXG94408.1 Uncharacterised protein [Klebsiella pneumoniae]
MMLGRKTRMRFCILDMKLVQTRHGGFLRCLAPHIC